jgi:hypothetical protein
MSVSSAVHFLDPRQFTADFIQMVVNECSGLTPSELSELQVRCFVEPDISLMRVRFRVRIRWLNGHDMRQLDFYMNEDLPSVMSNTEMVRAFATKAVAQANLRGELQFHRLEQRLPRRIKEVFVGPITFREQPIPAGSMIIIFNSGATLVCTELETMSDEFIAKCLMVA